MKGLSYSFLRAVCALVIGLVLVMFPNQAGDYFVITIGVIFLVPSLISITSNPQLSSSASFLRLNVLSSLN